jgi:hypothetical protein
VVGCSASCFEANLFITYKFNAFPSNVGVFQGDNLSPNLFNFYIDELIDDFDHSCSPVLLGQKLIFSGFLHQ